MAKSHIIEYYRNDRPEDLIFGLVTSILLHCIVFLGSKYWLRAFAPEQKLAQPIPVEYVEVAPNQTKTPPETSRRATKDSVAGGEANPKRPVSAAKSGSPSAHKASASKSTEAFSPELKQSAAVLPNVSPQKPQPRPQKIAVAPDTTPPEAKPPQTAVAPDATPPEPKAPQTAVAPDTTPLITKLRKIAVAPEAKPPQTAVTPDTTPLITKLRKIAVAPEPKPLPTAVTPDTTPLITKLRKIAVAPEPKPLPTAVTPDTTPLVPKTLQTTVASKTTPQVPKPLPTAVAHTTTPLVKKLRKIAVTPTTTPPEPKPLPTEVLPSTTRLVNQPSQTAVSPTTTPPVFKQRKIAVAPATAPQVPKLPKTAATPTTRSPMPSTHHENKNRLATKSTSSPSGTKTISRTPSQVQPSRKSGVASRLGGPVSISMRDYGSNSSAAAPNSNRFNRFAAGIDARQDVTIASYLEQLQQKVRQQWVPGLTHTSRRTVLHFTVDREGEVNNLQVAQTSGSSDTDQAALSAVKRAAPFGSMPTSYRENHIDIEFTFKINIYGQLDIGGGGY